MMSDFIQRWWLGRDLPVGIYLSRTEIVATYSSHLGATKHPQSISGPMPQGGFEDGTILKAEEVGLAIRHTISKTNCVFDRCGVALEPSAYFMKKIAPPTNIIYSGDTALTRWALEHFGFDPVAVNGYVVWSEGKSTAVFVGVKRQVLDSYQTAMKLAQLDLDVVTPRPIALYWLARRRLGVSLRGACVLIDARIEGGYIYQFDRDGNCEGIYPFRASCELSEGLSRAISPGEKELAAVEPSHSLNTKIILCIDADSQTLVDDMRMSVNSFAMSNPSPHSAKVVGLTTGAGSLVSEALAYFLEEVDVS